MRARKRERRTLSAAMEPANEGLNKLSNAVSAEFCGGNGVSPTSELGKGSPCGVSPTPELGKGSPPNSQNKNVLAALGDAASFHPYPLSASAPVSSPLPTVPESLPAAVCVSPPLPTVAESLPAVPTVPVPPSSSSSSSSTTKTDLPVHQGSISSSPLADRKHSCAKCASLGLWCHCPPDVNHLSTPATATCSNNASGGSREATEA
jgi:hypothetical protein